MDDLANVILSKLIFYDYIDSFDENIDFDDIKEAIHNLWKDYNNVKDIINEGFTLDYIINNDDLIYNILDIIHTPNDKDMDNIDSMYDELDKLGLLDTDWEDEYHERFNR